MFEVSEQLIHETLHMGWEIPEAHQGDCRMFETTVTDDCEMIAMVWMDKELEKEACGIDDCEIVLFSYRFNDVWL